LPHTHCLGQMSIRRHQVLHCMLNVL
jgi:hypothetical protein